MCGNSCNTRELHFGMNDSSIRRGYIAPTYRHTTSFQCDTVSRMKDPYIRLKAFRDNGTNVSCKGMETLRNPHGRLNIFYSVQYHLLNPILIHEKPTQRSLSRIRPILMRQYFDQIEIRFAKQVKGYKGGRLGGRVIIERENLDIG